MSLTRTAARTRIRTLLREPTPGYYTDAEINNWIADACLDISNKTFCNQDIATSINTVSNSSEYTWPTTFNATNIITLDVIAVVNSNAQALTYVAPDQLGLVDAEAPAYKWTKFANQVILTPTPTAAHSLDFYIIREGSGTAAGTLDLDSRYHHLVPIYGYHMGLLKSNEHEKAMKVYADYQNEMNRISAMIQSGIIISKINKESPPAGQ